MTVDCSRYRSNTPLYDRGWFKATFLIILILTAIILIVVLGNRSIEEEKQQSNYYQQHKISLTQQWDVIEPRNDIGPTLYRTPVPGGWLVREKYGDHLIYIPAKNREWPVD